MFNEIFRQQLKGDYAKEHVDKRPSKAVIEALMHAHQVMVAELMSGKHHIGQDKEERAAKMNYPNPKGILSELHKRTWSYSIHCGDGVFESLSDIDYLLINLKLQEIEEDPSAVELLGLPRMTLYVTQGYAVFDEHLLEEVDLVRSAANDRTRTRHSLRYAEAIVFNLASDQ